MAPKGIVLHINSPGGDVIAGIGLMRIVARSRVPIIVFVEGLSASAATFISVLAKYRVIAPYASILVHQYAGFNFGQRDLLLHQTNIGEAMFSMIQKLYKKHTKIPHQYLDELLEHDLLLDAKLSVEFGLMDKELHRDISPLVEKYFSITSFISSLEFLADFSSWLRTCSTSPGSTIMFWFKSLMAGSM